MKQSVLILAATAAVAFAQNNTVIRQVVLKESPRYTLDYNVINSTSANPVLNVSLQLTGYDTSSWTTANGKTGVYLGLGFGEDEMQNIDAINCLFLWNNRTNDTFMCTDTWFDGNRQPVTTPEAQDAKNVRTGLVNV